MPSGEDNFTITQPHITFGASALDEAGSIARDNRISRALIMTDKVLAQSDYLTWLRQSLAEAGIACKVYDRCTVEPTDRSFAEAAQYARSADVDGFISLGGGSVMDTCKAASLYATYPDEFLAYVNAPIGLGKKVPGALPPHIACPTTGGTGSECTGIAIFDLLSMKTKTGIMSRRLTPSHALIDSRVTATLPRSVLTTTALDAACHAMEGLTCRPFTQREKAGSPALRPMTQGRNPWSSLIAREALRIIGNSFASAISPQVDIDARGQMLWAACLAGNAFGNSGCHVPHGMSYSVSGMVRDYRPPDYPAGEALIPHGMSVILNAPAIYRRLPIDTDPLLAEIAQLLGDDSQQGRGADRLANHLVKLMRMAEVPSGLEAVGYSEADIPALVEGAWPQRRLLDNSPIELSREDLAELYADCLRHW